MSRLSELNYASRRRKLLEQITEAQEAQVAAAFEVELGAASEDDLAPLREQVGNLKDRLTGLDAAWHRAQAEAAAEQAERERVAREAALAEVDRQLAERAAAGAEMEELSQKLAAAWTRWELAGRAIVTAVAPFGTDLGNDGRRDLADLVLSPFHSLKPAVGAVMERGGLTFAAGDFSRFRTHHDTVAGFVEARNRMIRNHVAGIAPALPQEELAA